MSEAIQLGSNAIDVPHICRLKCVHNKMTNEYMIGEMATWIE